VRLRFDPKANVVIVSAQILGPFGEATANLIVDTGATWSLLSRQVLLASGYEPDAPGGRRVIVTASGSESVRSFRVQRLRALGKERADFPVICHDLPTALRVDGLLGLDFIRRYRLSIDFPAGFISLRP
jgi:hypothetical protein